MRHLKVQSPAYISKEGEMIEHTVHSSKTGKMAKYIIPGLGFSVWYDYQSDPCTVGRCGHAQKYAFNICF